MFDISGRKVLNKQIIESHAGWQTITLDMTGLAEGQYLVEVISDEEVMREKIIYAR